MSGKRQKRQCELTSPKESRSEVPKADGRGIEPRMAERQDKSPVSDEQVMEEVCERENCKQALARFKSNKGNPGIDGMTVEELPGYLKEHWPEIRDQLLGGTYRPRPVKQVDIPKPDGGVCQPGIPTVLD